MLITMRETITLYSYILRIDHDFLKVKYRSNGPGVIIVNIILCSDVCFTHVITINLLTYILNMHIY
jgi:hypothetical protein